MAPIIKNVFASTLKQIRSGMRWISSFRQALPLEYQLTLMCTCELVCVTVCVSSAGVLFVLFQEGHSRSVYAIAFQNDGALVASG